MNRREFLNGLRQFCLLYGIQNVLSEDVFAAAAAPQRMVNFIIKYTGGGTNLTGVGDWTTAAGKSLSPLAAYASDLVVPLGLHTEFSAPMNSHAAPQVSSLSGSMTGFVMRETQYPLGNLEHWSSGGGRSIDVMVGEKLKAQYKTKLPYLLIGNLESPAALACTHKTSSWGAGGVVLPAFNNANGLAEEIRSNMDCLQDGEAGKLATLQQGYNNRLAALDLIRKNANVFKSKYLIDQKRFEEMRDDTAQIAARFTDLLSKAAVGLPPLCPTRVVYPDHFGSASSRSTFQAKMDHMYNLAIRALQLNITRVVTFNLCLDEAHVLSHYGNNIAQYHEICRYYQTSVAAFMAKLKAANLYTGTLVYCNAGSCSATVVHNYENLSTYVINAGVSGVRGSAAAKKPIGSLLAEIGNKFGLGLTTYGGTDHLLGVGRPSGFLS